MLRVPDSVLDFSSNLLGAMGISGFLPLQLSPLNGRGSRLAGW